MTDANVILCASGFAAAGFALSHPGTLIVERTEFADAFRYAPLTGFACPACTPQTREGKELLALMEKHGVIADGFVNVNALESILCAFLKDKNVDMLLKADVLNREEAARDGVLKAYTNSGVLSLRAKAVLFPPKAEKSTLSVLYACQNDAAFADVFPHYPVERAFYEGRRVVYADFPDGSDFNAFRADMLTRSRALGGNAKMLYMASVPGEKRGTLPHPAAQFEAGLLASADTFDFDPKEAP